MNRDEILKDIKQRKTYQPDEELFGRILSSIESDKAEPKPTPSRLYTKARLLRPAIVFYVIILIIASTFAVTAAVNGDVRDYLISIFGGDPNPVDGELIGVTVESNGVELTVDAVVAEADSLFMIYTLKDKAQSVFNESTSINTFKAMVGGSPNYGAVYNSIIKNGEKNYMVLNRDETKKGVQQVQFSIDSLRTPDPSKKYEIQVGTSLYKPDGIEGYVINDVKKVNDRIEASITISDQSRYVINYAIKVKNTKTGMVFNQKAEEMYSSEGNITEIRWYSEKLDGGKAEDYQLMISFDKVYTFEKPLQVDFAIDFSRKPLKAIYPKDTYVLSAVVEKVIVNQMSVIADLNDLTDDPVINDEKPMQASEPPEKDFFEEDHSKTIPGQRMIIRYEDGLEADAISGSVSSIGQNRYRFYLILNGSLDYTRKPVLFIGDAEIPLF